MPRNKTTILDELNPKPLWKVSVRDLVSFVCMGGDIVSGFGSQTMMQDGAKIHREYQDGSEEEDYHAEVLLSCIVESELLDLEISGRADAVFIDGDVAVVEEIKSTRLSLKGLSRDTDPTHWPQALCYAWMLIREEGLDEIQIRLTYVQAESKKTRSFIEKYTAEEVNRQFQVIVDEYLRWCDLRRKWEIVRNESLAEMNFPYPAYRRGQRELAVAVYRGLRDEKTIFAQAPTGIGKTLATVFPALKALGEGKVEKVFYLTAKTLTRTVAENTLDQLRSRGVRFRCVTLTAKEKICLNEKVACNPQDCAFAKGHYDRIKTALWDLFEHEEVLSRDVIIQYAQKHRVCPFEFSLDTSSWSDGVICDYNYAFDPRVYLKRFFLFGGDYALLIDEAHNLVDRAREMYSAEICRSVWRHLGKEIKVDNPKLATAVNRIARWLLGCRNLELTGEPPALVLKEQPDDLIENLQRFMTVAEKWLVKGISTPWRESLIDRYFEAASMVRISEFYDERYVTVYRKEKRDLWVKLYCMDPADPIRKACAKGKGTVFFSATLTPMNYYLRMLGGNEKSVQMQLPSPFPKEHLLLMLDRTISTRLRDRDQSYDRITEAVAEMVSAHIGNYLVFFPSYKYMEEVVTRFQSKGLDVRVMVQAPKMAEIDREAFLSEFDFPAEGTSLVGFAVLGGIFGEGIDLTGDRLTGAVIIGTGLPQVSPEQEVLKGYFDEMMGTGYDYAYTYPGFARVLQSLGRVIRTESDRGVALLIDERYGWSSYYSLFPRHWPHPHKVSGPDKIKKLVEGFFEPLPPVEK